MNIMMRAILALTAMTLLMWPRGDGRAGADWPRMLPATPRPARDLIVVDWRPASMADRPMDLAVRSLQGLVNRQQPRIWVGTDDSPGEAGWWLKRFQEMGLVNRDLRVISADEFLREFKHVAHGAVVPPDNLGDDGHHVAVMKAAADGLMVASPELARSLGLRIVADYRGRFHSHAESYRYAFEHFLRKGRLSKAALVCERDDLRSATATVDYAVQHKLFQYTIHADAPDELAVLGEVLTYLPDAIPILGTAGGGNGYIREGPIVSFISGYAKFYLGCSGAPNLSVHAGFPPPTPEEMRRPLGPEPTLDPGKIYLCIQMSDGDNTNVARSHLLRKKEHWRKRGRIPIGWTVPAGGLDLIPGIMRYYYLVEPPTKNDEFIMGLSGAGYMFPGEFGRAPGFTWKRREAAWRKYLDLSEAYRKRMGLRVLTIHHFRERGTQLIGRTVWRRYARAMPELLGILNGYGYFDIAAAYGGTITSVDGMPVSPPAYNRMKPDGDVAAELRQAAGDERPAFLHVFWIPMAVDDDAMIAQFQALPDEFEIVLPSDFFRLYRQAAGIGGGGG
jgi:hypothetical protein